MCGKLGGGIPFTGRVTHDFQILIEWAAVSEKRLTVPWEVCPGGPVRVVMAYSDGVQQVRLERAPAKDYDLL